MFVGFAKFFLDNKKLAVVMMAALMLAGAAAYAALPKQYNPSIVAPAFELRIPAPAYGAADASRLLTRALEDRVAELEGIDKLYGYATDGYAAVMLSFKVGTDFDAARARLRAKLDANWDARPFGISDVRWRTLDPEDLPQVSFAVAYVGTGLSASESAVYVRRAALGLRDAVRSVPGATALELVGGARGGVDAAADPVRLAAAGLDAPALEDALGAAAGRARLGGAEWGGERVAVSSTAVEADARSLAAAPVARPSQAWVRARDVASVVPAPAELSSVSFLALSGGTYPAAFLGVAKAKGTNAVDVVAAVRAAADAYAATLPADLSLSVVQDGGDEAARATGELMLHLLVSVAVVAGVLLLFLGFRNALNAAACIPLVLAATFVGAGILGYDVNRITLFALILVLGILVDDSIVVVENNARHLADARRTGKSAAQAVLDSVREVGPSVLFSTVTRVLSFVAMFFVTGMMGDYMGPIPVFATLALTASLFVAFSANPFLAVALFKKNSAHVEHKENRLTRAYGRWLEKFTSPDASAARRRFWLRAAFWGVLAVTVISLPYAGLFRGRMLPKADKDQAYVWIDLPRSATLADSAGAARRVSAALLSDALPEKLRMATSVSATAGEPFLPDFANLFRGAGDRGQPNQATLRVDLAPAHLGRALSSERWAIEVRPYLAAALSKTFPDAQLRLLEDPPGPPTVATFHLKAKGGRDAEGLAKFGDALSRWVRAHGPEKGLVDIVDSASTARRAVTVTFDPERLADLKVRPDRAQRALAAAFNPVSVGFAPVQAGESEPSEIRVLFRRDALDGARGLAGLTVLSETGRAVRLDEIAQISEGLSAPDVPSEGREPVFHIYAELGEGSVVYPTLAFFSQFKSAEFEKATGYRWEGSSPYEVRFRGPDGAAYRAQWGGEWEITMDTFRDLGGAMMLSLLAIFLVIVAQFRSFRTGGIVMSSFLFSFLGIFPGFSILYLIKGEYFTATAMIGAIALGGVVVGNAIILLDYVDQLVREGQGIARAVVEGAKKRLVPVALTSVSAVLGAAVIASDPVWSGLAWSIIWGLSASAALTLLLVPVFYYDHLLKHESARARQAQFDRVMKNAEENFTHPSHE